MHELAVTKSIFNVVLKHAEMNEARRVVGVSLRIGEMSDIVDVWLKKCFDYLSRDTIVEGAEIHIIRTPIIFKCISCGENIPVKIKEINEITCPKCNCKEAILVSGREFFIEGIEVI